jgi:hypothetical protein
MVFFHFTSSELLIKIHSKFNEKNLGRVSLANDALSRLYQLHFEDEKSNQQFLNAVVNRSRGLLNYLFYVVSHKFPNEEQLIEDFFKYNKEHALDSSKKKNLNSKQEISYLVWYLELAYPEKSFAEDLKNFIGKEKVEASKAVDNRTNNRGFKEVQ